MNSRRSEQCDQGKAHRVVPQPNDRRSAHPPCFEATRGAIRRWVRGRAVGRGVHHLCDELLGAADLAMVLAMQAWRPERGPFQPFAWQYVKRDTLRLLEAERRQGVARAEMAAQATVGFADDPFPDRELYREVVDAAGGGPAVEIALAHLVNGTTLRELASHRGCSIRQIRNQIQGVIARVTEGSANEPRRRAAVNT